MADGKKITKAEAKEMTSAYAAKAAAGSTRSVNFDAAAISELLGVKVPNGMRVYFAHNPEGKQTVVLQSGENFAEFGGICPPNCPPEL